MTSATQTPTRRPALSQRLYRTLWRWHFYAGIFCIPFIITLALSGAIYLFKPQFEAWADAPVNNLAVSGQRASANELIATAQASMPGADFLAYRLPAEPDDAVVVSVRQGGERMDVYLDPYRNQILKTLPYESRFMRQVQSFHGELLAGRAGSILVELAACWAVILLLSGLYLWWPRSTKGLAGVLYPRLRQGGRVFWRDLHAVTGMWLSALTLFLLITGLPWATVWGAAFKEMRQWQAARVQQDWNPSRAQEKKAWGPQAVSQVNLPESVIASAAGLGFAPPVELSIAEADTGLVKVSSQTQNRPLRADAWIRPDGEVTRVKPYAERPLVDRVVGIGIAAHEGQLFGWFNQLLGLIVTLGLVLLSVSGAVLWWRRRPAGTLGAPAAMPSAAAGKVVAALVLLLGVLLPVVGLSLIALWLLEFFVLRRWRASRNWLGLASNKA
ncbi:PepSY-associated TM helix domain-containing protein [Gilvimarinus algae]|uniref:PepSY domain-containing protein n=1 Tax=Gilvimarinus algae TaxID=3058037 RepID=A0ABT8TJE7_9GAMM|nr:PepSY domain-containing protein [Gilvimarinus sp. SDUM040014]MDO3383483.1 PepSY domain-containing protein [Gilvimarinus sp. SDUM040014]